RDGSWQLPRLRSARGSPPSPGEAGGSYRVRARAVHEIAFAPGRGVGREQHIMNLVRLSLLFLAPPLFATAAIHTDFEGGSLGRVEKVSEVHFRLGAKGEKDQDGRNRQANWYYFRVDGAPKKEVLLDIVGLPGEYNYQPNRGAITKDTPPLISYDQRTWRHVETFEYDPDEPKLRLRITPAAARFWIAHVPPYTGENLARLRADASRHADFHEQVIGKTAAGRDLVLWTIASPNSGGAKKTV